MAVPRSRIFHAHTFLTICRAVSLVFVGHGLPDVVPNGAARSLLGVCMKRGGPRHRKTEDLAERLGLEIWQAVGLLEMLFHLAQEQHPRGDVGARSNKSICGHIGWRGDADTLIRTLVLAGWLDECLDHRLLIHGWEDHADGVVRKWLQRNGVTFATRRRPVTDQSVTSQCPPPMPTLPCLALPVPALPILASPSPNPDGGDGGTVGVPVESVGVPDEPRIAAMMGVGFPWGVAGGLLRRYSPEVRMVENYCERAMSPGINNRIAFVTSCIRECREYEAVQAPEDDKHAAEMEAAIAAGIARAQGAKK